MAWLRLLRLLRALGRVRLTVGGVELRSRLNVSPSEDGLRWVLNAPLAYIADGRVYMVPMGFETDFASTPRVLWWWLPPFGRYTSAAVAHDHLYASRYTTRREADRIFFLLMAEGRTKLVRAFLMWGAVRLFGWRAWRKK